jgi:hypothetical protein
MLTRLKIDADAYRKIPRAERGKQALKACKIAEPVPASDSKLFSDDPYKGFQVQVYERLDVDGPLRFQPVILKDGKPVHQIHVRSKRPEISANHFAKRAIDVFEKTGQWPAKQGLTIQG